MMKSYIDNPLHHWRQCSPAMNTPVCPVPVLTRRRVQTYSRCNQDYSWIVSERRYITTSDSCTGDICHHVMLSPKYTINTLNLSHSWDVLCIAPWHGETFQWIFPVFCWSVMKCHFTMWLKTKSIMLSYTAFTRSVILQPLGGQHLIILISLTEQVTTSNNGKILDQRRQRIGKCVGESRWSSSPRCLIILKYHTGRKLLK